ncbi:hypothetical protein HY605_02980 [Candidatus Peregrinibacteria bacterium]|nr:hypothetical protein [Candidatus Peregrinibacteria bacterium]
MYISLDLETTGFDPENDKIIEFGAIKFDLNGHTATLQILINPGISIPQIVTHITHIKDEDVESAPIFEEKSQEISDFIGDLPIIGHNIQFDTGFLKANGLNLKNLEFDTHDMAGILLPNMPSYSLEILSQHFDLQHAEKHRALDDAIAAMELFLKLREEFESLNSALLKKIQDLSQKSNWDLKEFLKDLKPQNHPGVPKIQSVKSSTPGSTHNIKSTVPTLHLLNPPYNNLAIQLAQEADPNTYIAVPYQLFRDIEAEIPDSIAKIDLAQNYISPSRLEQFSNKEFYENHEIIALIKYLVWLPQTKTGLLSELRLHQEERATIPKVNIPEGAETSQESFYQKALQKDQNAAALCTHDYIIQNPNKFPLIIVDAESFFFTLHRQNSIYLTAELANRPLKQIENLRPENKITASLSDKLTILFGLTGMIFKKCNDQNAYTPRSNITPDILSSKEWLEAKGTLNNLIESSKDLAELKDQENDPHLQSWKRVLYDLSQIYQNPELENHLVWIELDQEQEVIIHKIPFNINDKLKEILSSNYQLIDQVSLPPHIDLDIQTPETQALKPKILISNDTNENNQHEIVNYLKGFELKGKTFILFNSKKDLEFYTLELSKANVPLVSQLTGSLGKLKELIKETDKAFILITNHSWEKLDPQEDMDTLFIQKIPFDPPSDPILTALSQNYSDPFGQLQIPRAIRKLKKILTPLKENQVAVILDSRIVTKKYSQDFLDSLPGAEQVGLKDIFNFLQG